MRCKLDENLPIEAADLLRAAGHEASTAAEQGLTGAGDDRIAELCRAEERVLFSLDLDFGNIRRYPPRDHAGIVVLRLRAQDRPYVLVAIERFLLTVGNENLAGRLWIVDEVSVRVHD